MRRIIVLDTSTLIADPIAWKQFADCDVYIPIVVLNELDKLKKQPGEVGRAARVCIRHLDEISNSGDICAGIQLENDTSLKIDITHPELNNTFGDPTYADSHILYCAYALHQNHPERETTLVSNDINLRVKAKARGLQAIPHEVENKAPSDLYSGLKTIVDGELGAELQRQGVIDPRILGIDLNPHECVAFQNENGDEVAVGRKVSHDRLKMIKKHCPWNIQSRNKEQNCAIDLIMDKNVDLVTLVGSSGTGKSIVALAACIDLVLNKRLFDKLIIYRPIQPVGKDIGFLPGLLEEKLAPWFQAIMDNFEVLLSNRSGSDWRRDLEMFQKKGRINLEAVTFIRGRSINDSIILLDECQNISREEIKAVLTRAGERSKIILTGDIEQIDSELLDATNNGLTYTIEKFKTSELAGHITLTQGERSRLATLASKIL